MTRSDTIPAMHQKLTTEVEIAAYVHRTRMDMLAVLRAGPATLTQIARQLGVHPANLTRHMRVLEAAGLARLVEKRDTGRNLEKWYAASAMAYEVAPGEQSLKAPHKIALAMARSDLAAACERLPDSGAGTVTVRVIAARLTQAQIAVIEADIARLADLAAAGDGTLPYHLTLALYPGDPTTEAQLTETITLDPKSQS